MTEDDLKSLAEQNDVNEDFSNNKQIKKLIMDGIEGIRKQQNFNSLEKIFDVLIVTDNWEKLGLFTTTMKKKRHAIEAHYKKDIEHMYSKLN